MPSSPHCLGLPLQQANKLKFQALSFLVSLLPAVGIGVAINSGFVLQKLPVWTLPRPRSLPLLSHSGLGQCNRHPDEAQFAEIGKVGISASATLCLTLTAAHVPTKTMTRSTTSLSLRGVGCPAHILTVTTMTELHTTMLLVSYKCPTKVSDFTPLNRLQYRIFRYFSGGP